MSLWSHPTNDTLKVTKNYNELAACGEKRRKRRSRKIVNNGVETAVGTGICKVGSGRIGKSGFGYRETEFLLRTGYIPL
jgi:hypothetical protein